MPKLLSILLLSTAVVNAAEKISYSREILPILSDKCFYCHGPDKDKQEADLRLDVREAAIEAFAWDTEQPDESEALIRIFSDDEDEIMPPPDSHRVLTDHEKQLIKRWVAEGAKYETHWAFVTPPAEVPVPETTDTGWVRNPIDAFVLERLEMEKLTPSPAASPERWLRRVTLDLTGLPPTQAEIGTFLADKSPSASAAVVDRLLASPRFGERMATPWLDLARYADSFGFQADIDTEAWPYRDWVIRSFNENLPIDQFIVDQLAGDLLENPTRDQVLATAFNRIHRKTNEGGSVPEEFRQDGISDRVHTIGTAFMALTFECSRCHDHKYDPITAKDYYSLGAFFNSIDEHGLLQGGSSRGSIVPQPALQLPTPAQEQNIASLQNTVNEEKAELEIQLSTPIPPEETWLASALDKPLPDLALHIDFEKPDSPLKLNGNKTAAGKLGDALLADGDSITTVPDQGILHADQPFSISLWLKPAEDYPRATIVSNTTASGENFSGYALVVEKGILSWTLSREAPGSAASIATTEKIPLGEWTHIAVTNDGSRSASGLTISINGIPAKTITLSDNLKRDILLATKIDLAGRDRDSGLAGGMIDDFQVYHRALTELEVASLATGKPISSGKASPDQLAAYYHSAIDEKSRKLSLSLASARAALRTAEDEVREVSVMRESHKPVSAYILTRGDYTSLGEKVGRETPDWLPPFPANQPQNRLGFAKWLLSPDHPLTARVTINRIWQEIFGTGIVATSDNFGLQGEQPSHPELLDWLARDFMNHGWDQKRAIRQMVLSATYAQDSTASAELRERDPANALLARGPARRLTAEQLRDSALSLSGLLSEKIGGPPVKPYQAPGSMWKTLNNFLPEYVEDKGEGLYRRSLYTFWRRTTTPPNMMIFDTGTRDVCAARRQTTNTLLQPLVMLNDPQFVEAARKLGERIQVHGGETDEARANWAFREVIGKPPTSEQLPLLVNLISEQREFFKSKSSDAEALLKIGDSPADPALNPTESATFAMLAQALLNLDAFIMER